MCSSRGCKVLTGRHKSNVVEPIFCRSGNRLKNLKKRKMLNSINLEFIPQTHRVSYSYLPLPHSEHQRGKQEGQAADTCVCHVLGGPLCAQVATCCEVLYLCLPRIPHLWKKHCYFVTNGLNCSVYNLTFPCALTSFKVSGCCYGFFLLVSAARISALLTSTSEQLSRRKRSPQWYNNQGSFAYCCSTILSDVKYWIYRYFDTWKRPALGEVLYCMIELSFKWCK